MGRTGGDECKPRLVRVEVVVSGHYGHPEGGYEQVYEEDRCEGGRQQQGQHGAGYRRQRWWPASLSDSGGTSRGNADKGQFILDLVRKKSGVTNYYVIFYFPRIVTRRRRWRDHLRRSMVLARCAVGLTCKAFLNLGLCSLSVDGLPHLLSELQSPRRQEGQGIITGQRLLQPKERY
jgi:hypothetical protein